MADNLLRMLEEWGEAWNSHQVEGVLSCVTDDIVYEDLGEARAMRGKAEMRTWLNNMFSAFPDFKMDFKALFVSGDWAGTEWVMSGAFKGELQPFGLQPTGKSFSVRGASITEMRGGKVKRHADYYDGTALVRQLGVT